MFSIFKVAKPQEIEQVVSPVIYRVVQSGSVVPNVSTPPSAPVQTISNAINSVDPVANRPKMLKITAIVLAIIVVAVSVIACTGAINPQPIILSGANVVSVAVSNREHETIHMDSTDLINILQRYSMEKTLKPFAPYQQDLVDYEISLVVDQKPLHILLGQINLVYESSEMGGYEILNAQALIDEVYKLHQNVQYTFSCHTNILYGRRIQRKLYHIQENL